MASHSASTDWQSKILKKEYQNWLAVGHALSLMCDGLRPYIEREMKAFHQALLANLASVPPCTCPRPPKHTCAWAAQLARCHRGGKPNSPRWHQSDSRKWTDPNQGYWEVAKLFMSDLGPNKATILDASNTDCTGLTNLLFWCVYFRVQVHLVDAVRETRNTKWGHAARQELTDGEKTDALTTIRNLLQDPELLADNDAKSALAEINLMEKDFDAQSIERKVLADGLFTVGGQLDGIEDEIADFKKNYKTDSKKMQKRLLALENKQTKTLKLLQSIYDRMEEERNRNISYATQGINLAGWAFTGCKNTFNFVANLFFCLNTRSLTLLMALMVLMGSFRCLSHNSYNDGKYRRPIVSLYAIRSVNCFFFFSSVEKITPFTMFYKVDNINKQCVLRMVKKLKLLLQSLFCSLEVYPRFSMAALPHSRLNDMLENTVRCLQSYTSAR